MRIYASVCVALAGFMVAAQAGEPPKWITEGPHVEQTAIAFELPLNVLATKLFVEVDVGGKPRRFVFDTGSPSMLSKALAAELGLKVIDKRQGRDAHGAIIDTEIAQTELTLAGTTFRKVPVFIAEFPSTAQCLFDGVLGSELLPLCAWQIDLPAGKLRCNSQVSALEHTESATKLPLHTFGYPHTPILDIQFAEKAKSKAMFDTGAPEYLTISSADYEGAKRHDGINKSLTGEGSLGGSLGGTAKSRDQRLAQLPDLRIANLSLGKVVAPMRELSPSLLGASLLEHFIVTLDTRSSTAYFDAYRDGPFFRSSFGFGFDFESGPLVSLVWDDSPAAKAGLKPGQRITELNGKTLDQSCESIRYAMQTIAEQDSVELMREGERIMLTRQPLFSK